MWDTVWAYLNSPLGITVVGAVVAFLIAKLFAAKPGWAKYQGTIISAIRYAEKAIPDGSPNTSIARLDAALKYVLAVIEESEKRTPSEAEQAILKDGISLLHSGVEQELLAKLGIKADTAAKTVAPLLLCAFLLGGCFEAPPAVIQGHETAATCVQRASQNYNATIVGLEQALRVERKSHADYALDKSYENVKRDAAANGGKVDAEKALAYVRGAHDARDKSLATMEESIAKFRAAAALGDREAALALELMGELKKYDAAGVDPAKTASGIVEAIPGILPADFGK
jgi:hypothetical protein